MEFKAFFVLVLIFFLIFPIQAAVINPSVESQSWLCKYSVTKWACDIGGGKGTINLPDNINITQFISNFQNSTFSGNVYNNSTIWYSNLTDPVFNGDVNYFQYSEMNQTPNMTSGPAGPQGPPGPQGEMGPMNLTANMTAGPMNMTANMTAGPKGDTGAQGPAGAKGDKGDQGIQGIQGINGTPGADGYTPIFGVDYFNGSAGPQGVNGTPGEQGPQGPTGPANMTAGPQGINGTPGAQGLPGMDANVSTMWPVDSVYITTSSSSPASLLGSGAWGSLQNVSINTVYSQFSPTMTSNTAPSPNSTLCKDIYSGSYPCWYAFDGSLSNEWVSSSNAVAWAQMNTSASHTITKYTIYPRHDVVASTPTGWFLNASTDGVNWVTLDTQSGISWSAGISKSFTMTNTNPYSYFRIAGVSNANGFQVGITEIYLYETSSSDILHYWRRTS